MRVWNELMIREHPQGAGPLVGAQMRYLIGSEHGWLGGFGFGAAALQLRDRDQWIGWDLPAEVLFSDPEIEVLQAYAKKTDHQADSAR